MKDKHFSIKFIIHPLSIVFYFILIYLGYYGLLIAYLPTIILHELAHSYIADRLGYRLNKIVLMPYGVAISGNNMYFTNRDEIYIAIAGPLFNIILAVICIALWWIFPTFYSYSDNFVLANISIAIINFLPIYPLDGGRVLLGVLCKKHTREIAKNISKMIGIILSILLLVLFVITTFFTPNYTMLMFGMFLFVTTLLGNDARYNVYSSVNEKMKRINKGVVLREVAVSSNDTLYKLFRTTTLETITTFNVLDNNLNVVKKIKESDLEKLLLIYPVTTTLNLINI